MSAKAKVRWTFVANSEVGRTCRGYKAELFYYPGLKEQIGDVECDEGCDPGQDDGVDCCDDGPFPSAGLVPYGDEGRHTREVEEDEDHIGKCACRCHGIDQGLLEASLSGRLRRRRRFAVRNDSRVR